MHSCKRSNHFVKVLRHSHSGIAAMTWLAAVMTSSSVENVLPANFPFKKENSQKSYGARSGEYGGWGKIPTPCCLIKSTVLAHVWGRALSWRRCKPRSPTLGRFSFSFANTLGRTSVTYHSEVAVSPLGTRVVVKCPSKRKKRWLP